MNINKSLKLFEEAKKVIPSVTQTFSKGWTQYPLGTSPIFLERADKGHVWDVDGNEYIDWPMGLGPIILGHNYPTVNEAVSRQMRNGTAFSLPHVLELKLAKRLSEWFPYGEMSRFGKNGSDATAGAVRAARAYTGRELVLCSGYHGWQDWFIGTTTRSAGVPEAVRQLTKTFPYNDLKSLEILLEDNCSKIAAIIMEPIGVEFPVDGYLVGVKELAKKHGAVLIFDECWTGFRLDKKGAYGYFGVEPDMACFGKAIGNGYPISVITGRREIMSIFDKIFYSFTFGGETLSMAAAMAVMDCLETEPVFERIQENGTVLFDGIKNLIDKHDLDGNIRIKGYPARNVMEYSGDAHDGLLIKSVIQEMAIGRGILCGGYHVVTYSHTKEDVDKTLFAYDEIFKTISEQMRQGKLKELLKGKMVSAVFRKA